ncbi:putative dithiol-disulfide isomerase involved in polyketide biosynthesis [Owenweeksia hongkongensis DSM 17368]|uniref:Putative dithiol-disulfide isomerase involved in polyketide biosynthesis n=2 Tax=Owenweeksia TaxID=267986 RepID=G8R1A6_OWEHD|nr:putative dithiol-disulfide isomerase involved in polyketide biosynthesis [Owenweeksia hongkongensis DSM 17368]
MKVEIWSDVMCPFCYIGKRRFEKALSNFKHKDDIEVVWKSFQLDPTTVTNPALSVTEELARKKGWTLEQTREMSAHVTKMAEGEGLHYDFDKAVVANSFNAHRLLQFAKTQGKGDALKEALLYAYFTDGKNTDDTATLLELGLKAGLEKEEVEKVLSDESLFADAVNKDVAEAQQLRISGVPFFVLDKKYGISGAQELMVFEQNLAKAHEEWKATQTTTTIETIEGEVCRPDGTCD